MNKEKIKSGIGNVLELINPPANVKRLIMDINTQFVESVTVLVMSVMFGLMALFIVANGGLAGVFGKLMASICVNADKCDFNALMGVLSFVLIVLTSMYVYFMKFMVNEYRVANTDEAPGMDQYTEEQQVVLRKIVRLGDVDSLSAFANWIGKPYSTLYAWCKQFEADGWIRMNSNGTGRPLRLEAIRD